MPPIVQVLGQVEHKYTHFKTIIWKIVIEVQNKYSQQILTKNKTAVSWL